MGGPCDYCVSPSPKNRVSGFFRFGMDLGSDIETCWDEGLGLGLGLDNSSSNSHIFTADKVQFVKSQI